MAAFRTHYENLKIARNAPDAVIRAAYKALMQNYHPDKFEGSEQEGLRIAKLIKNSYDVLIDPVKRAEHDRWISKKEAEAKPAEFGETGKAKEQQYYQKEDKWRESTPTPPPSPPKSKPAKEESTPIYLWRRYFARLVDCYICGLIGALLILLAAIFWQARGLQVPNWIAAMLFNPEVPLALQQLYWALFSPLLWVLVEPIVLSNFGTTPGKALFRLRLVSDSNEHNYWGRSFTVWAVGMGFGIPVVTFFTNLIAAIRLKKKGKTDWDRWAGFSVEAEPLSLIRKLVIIALFVVLLFFNSVIDMVNKKTSSQVQTQPIQDKLSALDSPKMPQAPGLWDLIRVEYGVEAVHPEEALYYQRWAEQGNVYAQMILGAMNKNGKGVAKDYNKAAYWYRKAAEQGDAKAQYMLGEMYGNGQGVALDNTQAVYWYRKAAKQGVPKAREALGELGFFYMPGDHLADGSIVFYIDASGYHGLVAKAADEAKSLDWTVAKGAASFYGSGWRLPTKEELQLLYQQKSVVGGFSNDNYWSSTETKLDFGGGHHPWFQNFGNGVIKNDSNLFSMFSEFKVRAVRAF